MKTSPFRAGQAVICVRAASNCAAWKGSLQRGGRYVVRAVEVTEWLNGVRLEGFSDGPAPFAASRFVAEEQN